MYTRPYLILSSVRACDKIMLPARSVLIRLPIRAGSLKVLVTFTSMLLQKKIAPERKLLILISTLLIFFEESRISLTVGLMISAWILGKSIGQKECVSVGLVLANILMYKKMKNRIHSHLLIWCLAVTKSITPDGCCKTKPKRQKIFMVLSCGIFILSFLRGAISFLSGESFEESVIKGCALFCGMCPCSFAIGRPLLDAYTQSGDLTQSEAESILKILDTWSVLYNVLALVFGSGLMQFIGVAPTPGLSSLAMIHSTAVTYYILWVKLRNKKLTKLLSGRCISKQNTNMH